MAVEEGCIEGEEREGFEGDEAPYEGYYDFGLQLHLDLLFLNRFSS